MSTAGDVMSMSVREWQEATGYGTHAPVDRRIIDPLPARRWIPMVHTDEGWREETEEEFRERVMEAIHQIGRP